MDIVTECNVPRYLHNNFPLGNPLGAPWDKEAQNKTIIDALNLVSETTRPTVVRSSLRWPTGDNWQDIYNKVDDTNRARLLQMGEENRAKRANDQAQGLKR